MKIVIIQPFVESKERTKQLEEEAVAYAASLGYEVMSLSRNELSDIMRRGSSETDFNVYLLMIGTFSMLAAMAGTILFWEGWNEHTYCQDIFQIAFKYGVNILTKPSEKPWKCAKEVPT